MKTKKELKQNILAVAASQPNGFTVDSVEARAITEGFAVSVEATQNSFGEEGLGRAIKYAQDHDVEAIGGWLNGQTGLYHFDATRIFAKIEDAAAFAIANHQLAFFDLKEGREYRIAAGKVVGM